MMKATKENAVQGRWYEFNNLYKRFYYDPFEGNKESITLHTAAVMNYSEVPIHIFTLLDILKLRSLFKYRLHYITEHTEHLGIRNYPPLELVIKATKLSEFNFFFAYLIPAWILMKIGCKLGIYVYDTDEDREKVTWWRFFKETSLIVILADIGFYWMHRLMHTPKYYLDLHKVHHEFKYSIAMAHHWMKYKEAVLFTLPQVLPPLIIWALQGKRCHVTSLWAGVWFTQLNGTLGHAGYLLPFIPKWLPFFQASHHDYHHVDYSANFSANFSLTDWIFGTRILPGIESNMEEVMKNVKANTIGYIA